MNLIRTSWVAPASQVGGQDHVAVRVVGESLYTRLLPAISSELRREGARAALQLEREVEERVRGRPSAAPPRARALLRLRRPAIPTRGALERIDTVTLWQQLALLDVLRARVGLRRRGQGFVGRGLELEPIAGTPSWVILRPQRAPIGVLCPAEDEWEQVQMGALYCCWNVQHEGREIDRWVMELCHVGLPVPRRLPVEFEAVVTSTSWLGETK